MKIVVYGAVGRMGKLLVKTIVDSQTHELVGAIDSPKRQFVGQDAGVVAGLPSCGVMLTDSLEKVITEADVVIDFSRPEGALDAQSVCIRYQKPLLVCSTGFTAEQFDQLKDAATSIPILYAANTSIGINLLCSTLDWLTPKLSSKADIEIIEMHHRHKVDAPSGTALQLGKVIAQAMGQSLNECATYNRHDQKQPRKQGTIGFSSVRGGDIFGVHTALFALEDETIELTHRAHSRLLFAKGAVDIASFLVKQPNGWYEISDYLVDLEKQ